MINFRVKTIERGFIISELNALKECPWCGGKYEKGYEVSRSAKTKRSAPSSYCSRECWWAFNYKFSLGLSITLISFGIIFSVLYLTFPTIFQGRFLLETIMIIAAGYVCGLPSLWMTNRTRMIRREIPQYSRRGQRIDEPPKEYRDY